MKLLTFAFFPFVFLLASIFSARLWGRRSGLVFYFSALVAALASGLIEISALGPIGALLAFAAAAEKLPTHFQLLKKLSSVAFFALGVLMMFEVFPGFRNFLVFDKIVFSKQAMPFTMHLKFAHITVGLLGYIFFFSDRTEKPWTLQSWKQCLKVSMLLVATLIPVAMAVNYVKFDPKWPDGIWIWMINNFFFVCLVEEVLFRGLMQSYLRNLFEKAGATSWGAVGLSALLFGFAHFAGGWAYVGLAGIAGLFYGAAYELTRRLEASMLVHFSLNLVHFVLFTYPALQVAVAT